MTDCSCVPRLLIAEISDTVLPFWNHKKTFLVESSPYGCWGHGRKRQLSLRLRERWLLRNPMATVWPVTRDDCTNSDKVQECPCNLVIRELFTCELLVKRFQSAFTLMSRPRPWSGRPDGCLSQHHVMTLCAFFQWVLYRLLHHIFSNRGPRVHEGSPTVYAHLRQTSTRPLPDEGGTAQRYMYIGYTARS